MILKQRFADAQKFIEALGVGDGHQTASDFVEAKVRAPAAVEGVAGAPAPLRVIGGEQLAQWGC